MIMLPGLLALLCYTSCTSHKEEKEAETKFVVTSPLKADTTFSKDYVCQIHSINHIELRALEKGYLQSCFVDEGQHVKKGQLLFRIMPKLYEAEVKKAQAEVKAVNIEYDNTKSLADKNIVSANELALAGAKLKKAEAELLLAQTHLGFTNIRAPFDGIIDRFRVRVGSLLDEGELLTTLSDNSKMWVYFNVPEAQYLNFAADKKADKAVVKLIMANNQLFPNTGIVETIEAEFDNETGNIPFRATFPNPDRLLRHGETGNIRMTEPIKDGIIIPQKATFEVLDKKYVYVVDKNSQIKSKEITVGAEMEDLFVVTSGLTESDKILLEGLRKVKEDDKISYDYKDPHAVMTALKLPTE
ncbi:efflux RND transporter periplasmic adaptor subunit [Niabella ginsengisoli]|uniref:Efflux RND transporter periplasmic adaptor subunit n=1 Tax=Niabella ginsengisoli TaxID=522298 RepID=A0ABS9SR68_9BACT|nr:efflux RND transporter periplasmic adaptor subunit [Niabella ginsengisoli]MCH5600845.1 efflux RND transporter periplasmic adaptor subunit [Niabella ginsengisoli]